VKIELFRMERTQCLYENEVEYDIAESGVLALTVQELLGDPDAQHRLLETGLAYPYSTGSPELREAIADFYPGASMDNVLVTNGTAEANYTVMWALTDGGDRIAAMIPSYLQNWHLARIYGGTADEFHLVANRDAGRPRWELDLDDLASAVGPATRIVTVTNPNNPTGAVLSEPEMDAIVTAASRADAWIVADEVFRGAEVANDRTSPTFWGRHDKVIVTGGLSKAFGLPGLRIGWIVAPAETIADLCSYRDYTTLTPTLLSDQLATIAMAPTRRERILARTRGIIRSNLPLLEEWIRSCGDLLTYIRPVAGAIALVEYDVPIPSDQMFDHLRTQESVLITPGDQFGLLGRYIRIGYGVDMDFTLKALERVRRGLESLRG
jgi:aspartate/methionine/tyrosine aminotransferase